MSYIYIYVLYIFYIYICCEFNSALPFVCHHPLNSVPPPSSSRGDPNHSDMVYALATSGSEPIQVKRWEGIALLSHKLCTGCIHGRGARLLVVGQRPFIATRRWLFSCGEKLQHFAWCRRLERKGCQCDIPTTTHTYMCIYIYTYLYIYRYWDYY